MDEQQEKAFVELQERIVLLETVIVNDANKRKYEFSYLKDELRSIKTWLFLFIAAWMIHEGDITFDQFVTNIGAIIKTIGHILWMVLTVVGLPILLVIPVAYIFGYVAMVLYKKVRSSSEIQDKEE